MRIQVELVRTDFKFDLGLAGEQKIELGFEEGFKRTNAEAYTGEYEVTPRTHEQTLPTRNRLMAQDVVVRSIPYYEVDNTQRGMTAIIGGD